MSLRSNLHWQVGSSPHVPPGKPLGSTIMDNKSIINMYEISMQSDTNILFSYRGSLYTFKSNIRLRGKKELNIILIFSVGNFNFSAGLTISDPQQGVKKNMKFMGQ